MATLKNIAEECGVSIATVSYVLNGKAPEHHIPAETEARIREAAQRQNYTPGGMSRRAEGGTKVRTIGILWMYGYSSHELVSVFSGVERAVKASTLPVRPQLLFYDQNQLQSQWDELELQRYDGLVIFGLGPNDMAFLAAIRPKGNQVLVNRQLEGFASVSVDNRLAGRLACEKLFEVCGSSLSLVEDSAFALARATRSMAFRERAKELRIPIEKQVFSVGASYEEGYRLGLEFLEKGMMTKGIFFINDHTAVGFLSVMGRNGVTAGSDYYLLASGMGTADICRFARPSISSVDMKLEEETFQAMNLVIHMIRRRNAHPQTLTVQPSILFRESLPEIL